MVLATDSPELKAPGLFTTTIRSTLLLFLTLLPMMFMFELVHEGAHALSHLAHGGAVRFFSAGPFPMGAYFTPVQPSSLTVWDYASGHVVTLTASLLLFALLWRRRSVAILPLVMLFPWAASHALMTVSGLAQGIDDFNYVIDMTGWPAWPFFALFSILAVAGILLFVSFFPLLGLSPKDKRTLFVIPGGFLLWAVVGLMAAYAFELGSRAESQSIDGVFVALLMAVVFVLAYFTIYPVVERRLPAHLRTEARDSAWRDL
ncbi:MAG: hypothetical protein RI637_12830, partial [Acidimicrobiia bacterium]|nr:hypothetical protein [Acidimicrobiia bacterium]